MDLSGTHEVLVRVVEIMGIIGIPSFYVIFGIFLRKTANLSKNIMFISSAIKSQIRNELIKDFEIYSTRGWCSTIEQTEWLNRYASYHNLYGDNGVLDNKKNTMENMPNSPQQQV